MEKENYFTIYDTVNDGCISRFTESSGRVYLVRNPFSSNYFTTRGHAQTWLNNSGLSNERYEVRQFEQVPKDVPLRSRDA